MNDDDGGEGVVWVWVKHDKFGYVPAKHVSGTGKACTYVSLYGETMTNVTGKPVAQGGHIFGEHHNDLCVTPANIF